MARDNYKKIFFHVKVKGEGGNFSSIRRKVLIMLVMASIVIGHARV